MKTDFTSFMQHEYGVYSINDTENGLLGTEGVGPCIVFYVYNPAQQDCFAVHMSTGTSFQAVRKPLLSYLDKISTEDRANCKAFFVGGWQSYAALDTERLEKLNSLLLDHDITDVVKHLYEKKLPESRAKNFSLSLNITNPADYYAVVGFDLKTGKLLIEHSFKHNLNSVDRRNPEIQELIAQIKPYILMGYLTEVSDKLEHISPISKDAAEFLQSIVDKNDGIPLMPRTDIITIVGKQLTELAKAARDGEVNSVARLLFTMLINPCSYLIDATGLPKKERWTPLHYACAALNANSFPKDEYKYQLIITLIIMQAGRDNLLNANNKSALDLLKDPYHKNNFTNLLKLCSKGLTGSAKHNFARMLRCISIDLFNDVFNFDKSNNKEKKLAIHGKLINYLEEEIAQILNEIAVGSKSAKNKLAKPVVNV